MERSNQYHLNLPYPTVTVTKCDFKYADMISDAYAGRGSETTAIAQYRAHALYLQDRPEILAAYRGISEAEMTHQDLLGGLVIQLCAFPKLLSGVTKQFWNGSFPVYECRLLPILLADIQGEHDAIAHYRRLIACIQNESIQALLGRIILDEQLHVEILQSLVDRYGNT
ncbi:MAG TPA: hypothetical protein VN441_11205 [Syntrophomonas sp.]|nr:hypothetical protein [Syntrophomonas sp.]